MDSLGYTLRKIRKEKKIPLREVSDFLLIDNAILSKIECDKRRATRRQVMDLASFYKINSNDLLVIWLSDRLVDDLKNEGLAIEALQLAEEKVNYQSKKNTDKKSIIASLKSIFKNDVRVSAAWLFGSFSRGEDKSDSDIDIMIELNNEKKYSMFDILDISFLLEQKINCKIDLVEKGYLKSFAMDAAEKDLIKIYG